MNLFMAIRNQEMVKMDVNIDDKTFIKGKEFVLLDACNLLYSMDGCICIPSSLANDGLCEV